MALADGRAGLGGLFYRQLLGHQVVFFFFLGGNGFCFGFGFVCLGIVFVCLGVRGFVCLGFCVGF